MVFLKLICRQCIASKWNQAICDYVYIEPLEIIICELIDWWSFAYNVMFFWVLTQFQNNKWAQAPLISTRAWFLHSRLMSSQVCVWFVTILLYYYGIRTRMHRHTVQQVACYTLHPYYISSVSWKSALLPTILISSLQCTILLVFLNTVGVTLELTLT